MRNYSQFYIDGRWVDPVEPRIAEVINPATEAVSGTISLRSAADVDLAVTAARRAFESWSQTPVAQRLDLLLAIQAEYTRRSSELGEAVTEEMGAPTGLELGGKSAWVILDDADMAANVAAATAGMMVNAGQTCSAGSRLLVPSARLDEAIAAAKTGAESVTVGDPTGDVGMGPVVSKGQYNVVQDYIRIGLEAGAQLIAGGPGRPDGLEKGFYCRPTVFVSSNDTRIAREEIFGPVLVLIAYDDLDHAVAIANDSPFGLGGYVSGQDADIARSVARRLRTGAVWINGGFDFHAPFGGYKRSGNGREWGAAGFEEYLETKALVG